MGGKCISSGTVALTPQVFQTGTALRRFGLPSTEISVIVSRTCHIPFCIHYMHYIHSLIYILLILGEIIHYLHHVLSLDGSVLDVNGTIFSLYSMFNCGNDMPCFSNFWTKKRKEKRTTASMLGMMTIKC